MDLLDELANAKSGGRVPQWGVESDPFASGTSALIFMLVSIVA
jgi:hypothetical protein